MVTEPDVFMRPFPLHECAIDRAFPGHNQVRGEEVFVHKDGNFYPVAFCASPIRDELSKTIGTIIEVRDTSQEKLADAQRRLLISELDHRVKNTLATAQSLARQTFQGEANAALATYQGRLRALSEVHNILTTTLWQYVRRQNIWHRSRRKLAECGPRLLLGFRRRAYGVASADVQWSVA